LQAASKNQVHFSMTITLELKTLELKQISKAYGSQLALDHLSLSLVPGEIYCLLGHNGAGKTTTVHLLLNFIQPSTGEIWIAGQSLQADPRAALRQVAYIPELVMLYPELNACENLAYFSQLAGHRYSSAELEAFLLQAGLPQAFLKRRIGQYSKGMRQKVGIAIALAKQARLLVLDEPTSGLDPQASHEFSKALQSLAQSGVSIFMVTHDLFRVQELGARIGILKQGSLQRELKSTELAPGELEQIYLQVAS